MKLWRAAFFLFLGGLVEQIHLTSMNTLWNLSQEALLLQAGLLVSGLGWAWMAIGLTAKRVWNGLVAAVTGRPQALPTTDPKALAAEISALNAQISQLRDTATSFDVSFDHTLERLDERLRRVEQQSPYLPNTMHGGR